MESICSRFRHGLRARALVLAGLVLSLCAAAAHGQQVVVKSGDLLSTPGGSEPFSFYSMPAMTDRGVWFEGLAPKAGLAVWDWDRTSGATGWRFSVGEPVPGMTGWSFRHITETRIASGAGTYLISAVIQRGTEVTFDAYSVGLWTVHDDGAPRLRIRTRTQAPGLGTARIREITAYAINRRDEIALIATLEPGPGGTTTANDVVLYGPDGRGGLQPLIREGDAFEGGIVGQDLKSLEVAEGAVVVSVPILGFRLPTGALTRFDSQGRREILAKPGATVDAPDGARTLDYYDTGLGIDVNRQGDAFFIGRITRPGTSDRQFAYLRSDGHSIRALSMSGQPLGLEQGGPGRRAGSPAGPAASNAHGAAAFMMGTHGYKDDRRGLWWSDAVGALVQVAEAKQQVVVSNPGKLPAGEPDNPFPFEYRRVEGFALSDSGFLAFVAYIEQRPGDPYNPRFQCLFLRAPEGSVSILDSCIDSRALSGSISVPQQNYPFTSVSEDGHVAVVVKAHLPYYGHAIAVVPEAGSCLAAGCAFGALAALRRVRAVRQI